MVQIVWSPKSLRQIREISTYIAADSTFQAARLVQRIHNSVGRLTIFPRSGALISEYSKTKIREIRVFRYRVLYQLQNNDDVVRIVAVVHGSRKLRREMFE